jgi:hypothetical protein
MPELDGTDTTTLLFLRTEAFEASLVACFPNTGVVLADATAKHDLCATACVLSIEHASVLRAAFGVGAPNSGAALLRLQYEALLRAAWLLYSANPSQVEKLAQALNLEAEHAAKNMPTYMEMLDAVAKQAPAGLSAPLVEFNQYSRHALNSFVHSGIHPLRRAKEGFPVVLVNRIVLMSNGLLHFAYRMLAVLSGSKHRLDKVTQMYIEFKDCLPITDGKQESNDQDHP